MTDVTQILSPIEAGDPSAADRLLPLVYEDLRRRAQSLMASERPDHTLQATALVHDAYIRLVDVDQARNWNSRGHFFSAAAEAMRRILVEHARAAHRRKRGGGREIVELDDDLVPARVGQGEDLIDIHESLELLAVEDPEVAELVKLRVFAGLSVEEAGRVLGMARSTAYENWKFARAWFTSTRMVHDRQ